MAKSALGSPKSRIAGKGRAFLTGNVLEYNYKRTVGDLKAAGDAIKPDMPAEDPTTTSLRNRQLQDMTKLDEEQNLRIKGLLAGSRGGRFFRGSPLLRSKPADRAGGPARSMFSYQPGPTTGPVRSDAMDRR